jgi:hypothetical protein
MIINLTQLGAGIAASPDHAIDGWPAGRVVNAAAATVAPDLDGAERDGLEYIHA